MFVSCFHSPLHISLLSHPMCLCHVKLVSSITPLSNASYQSFSSLAFLLSRPKINKHQIETTHTDPTSLIITTFLPTNFFFDPEKRKRRKERRTWKRKAISWKCIHWQCLQLCSSSSAAVVPALEKVHATLVSTRRRYWIWNRDEFLWVLKL